MSPRRNPDSPAARARQGIQPARFLRDGRAVFNGDPLPDECQPGDVVLHNGQPVGIIGLDASNRVRIVQAQGTSQALSNPPRMQGANPTAVIMDEAARLAVVDETEPSPAFRAVLDSPELEAMLNMPEGSRITRVHAPHVQDEIDAAARRNEAADAAVRRVMHTTTPAEPDRTVFDDLEQASGLPAGTIQPIDFGPQCVDLPDLSEQAAAVMQSAGEAARRLSANLSAASMTDEEIRAAAIRRSPEATRAAAAESRLRAAEERLRDVRATLRQVREERDDLRRRLTNLNAGAERVGLAEAKAAARAWKETPVTDSVAKRDSFMHLLDTLEQLTS